MAENILRLNGPDGNKIYGMLRENGHRRLVVHLHGMTHYKGSLLEVTSADFFEAKGYDHYRISFYDYAWDSRRLLNSTLSTHRRDLETVLAHFRPLYDEIFISAHSLSGLVTLIHNPQGVKAISLWDPSFDATNFWASAAYLTHMPERKQYILDYGVTYVVAEEMVEEMKRYPDSECLKLAGQVTTPVQLIVSEQSIFDASPHTSPEAYRGAFGGPFDLQRITGAAHTFSYQGNREPLFQATLEWFERHSSVILAR